MTKLSLIAVLFSVFISCSENIKNQEKEFKNADKENVTNNPVSIVQTFINMLGEQEFENAYYLTKVNTWGDCKWFCSKKTFGGISSTKIKDIELRPDEGNKAVVYVHAFYEDPINGDNVFKQLFYLQRYAGEWKIVKLKQLKDKQSNKMALQKVSYSFQELGDLHNKIIAKLNGKTYTVLPSEYQLCYPFKVIKKDFNNNGYEDLLLTNADACGGNATVTSTIYFCSYNIDSDKFVLSKGFGSITGEPEVRKFNEKWIVSFTSGLFDELTKETYILDGNKAKQIEYTKLKPVKAFLELEAGSDKRISFDIDNDGYYDNISWSGEAKSRAERFDFTITLTNSRTSIILSGYRIGIIESKTNGIYDLVVGFDNIFQWNGYEYVAK